MNPASTRTETLRPRDRLPPVTIGEALARHWILIALATIAVAAVGIDVGLKRAPVYTSESELNVGSVDAQAQAIPGYTDAAQTLAEAYARIVQSSKIQLPVAVRTHHSLDYVAGNLTAANIPSNPVFRIDGSGPSAAAAESLTEAATSQVIRYSRSQTTLSGAANALKAFARQTATASQLSSEAGALRFRSGSHPTRAQQARLTQLQRQAAAAQLQANASEQVYINAISNSTSAARVSLLTPPSAATSNRKQIVEIAGFAGAAVGCLLGSVLAIALAARRRRQLIRSMMVSD